MCFYKVIGVSIFWCGFSIPGQTGEQLSVIIGLVAELGRTLAVTNSADLDRVVN